jgi:DNA-binding CsgD family transcriptional regulator
MHWSRHPLAAEACGALEGVTDAIAIGFRNGSDALVQIALGRTNTPFSERDLAMLRMLTPVLARLVRERPTPRLPVTLTVQERRVLSHVAAGRSNQEIAEHLFVAPSTVRKHLENAYRKLGVTGRVAAVARLQGRDLPDLDLRERLARLG